MIIEVRGVNFRNKGAELMLHAVLQNVRPSGRRPEFALHKRVGTPADRKSLGIRHHVVWRNRDRLGVLGSAYNYLPNLLPRAARRSKGIVATRELRAVLDASGYAFGDPWGPRTSEEAARYFRAVKRQGVKIILLPQQLGPFEDRRTRAHFSKILDVADLVFARDRVSLEMAHTVRPGTPQLLQAPDFTAGVPGCVPAYFPAGEPHVCIVPNIKMVAQTDPATAEWYRGFLLACARLLAQRKVQFSVLIHETKGGDNELALRLQSDLDTSIRIIAEKDPLAIKGILSSCHVTIGSRYHGLVSALSSAVPSLGTGWSHKYEMLFEDFGCSDYLVGPTERYEESLAKLDALLDGRGRAEVIANLNAGRERYLQQAADMWATVNALLL